MYMYRSVQSGENTCISMMYYIDRCRCTSSFVWPGISSPRPSMFPTSTCWLDWAVTHNPPTTALTFWRSTEWGQVGYLTMGQLWHMRVSGKILYTQLAVLMKWHVMTVPLIGTYIRRKKNIVFVQNYCKLPYMQVWFYIMLNILY